MYGVDLSLQVYWTEVRGCTRAPGSPRVAVEDDAGRVGGRALGAPFSVYGRGVVF